MQVARSICNLWHHITDPYNVAFFHLRTESSILCEMTGYEIRFLVGNLSSVRASFYILFYSKVSRYVQKCTIVLSTHLTERKIKKFPFLEFLKTLLSFALLLTIATNWKILTSNIEGRTVELEYFRLGTRCEPHKHIPMKNTEPRNSITSELLLL